MLALEPAEIGAQLDALDGLIFSGGVDIDPARYGQPAHAATDRPWAARDDYELQLARAADARRTPVLGICRGTQLLNVAYGGALIQRVPEVAGAAIPHALPDDDAKRRGLIDAHVVASAPDSLLARIAGETLVTGSRHHQAVDPNHLGAGLRVSARTADGIVEAIESTDATRFLLAVQWHPESTLDDAGASLALFRALVQVTARTP